MYKYIIIIILSLSLSKEGDFGILPTISFSWDNNIGFNYGAGLALGKWGQGTFSGIYTSYSFSEKGNNLSFGPYSSAFIASFRLAVTRLKLKENNQEYWGIQTSSSMFIGYLRLGILKNNNKPKLSYALGLGI